jgi:hypothetical protein
LLLDTNRFADLARRALGDAFFRLAGAARFPDFERPRWTAAERPPDFVRAVLFAAGRRERLE